MNNKKAQQEIVGFVLIVVVVVTGLMIYLTISLRTSPENEASLEAANALDAIMKQTTECAVIYVPDYDDFEDLFESACRNYRCKNLNTKAMDYLNDSLKDVLDDMMATEGSVLGYELQLYNRDDPEDNFCKLQILEGNCSRGRINSAKRTINVDSDRVDIVLKTCNF
jgi:hypothetical protein